MKLGLLVPLGVLLSASSVSGIRSLRRLEDDKVVVPQSNIAAPDSTDDKQTVNIGIGIGAPGQNINNNNNNVNGDNAQINNNNNNVNGDANVNNNNNNVGAGGGGTDVNNNNNNVNNGGWGSWWPGSSTNVNNNNNNIGFGKGWNLATITNNNWGPGDHTNNNDVGNGASITNNNGGGTINNGGASSSSIIINNSGNGDGSGSLEGKSGACSFDSRSGGFADPEPVYITTVISNSNAGPTFYKVSRCSPEMNHFCCDSGKRFNVCFAKDGSFLCQ